MTLRLDIVVPKPNTDDVSVLLGQGDGSFGEQTTYPVGANPWSVAVADLNNELGLDIIVTNGYTNDVSVAFWTRQWLI